jgi:hypothetical protein
MKTITDRGRKILSRLFRVISVSAASLILQACYGMMLPDEPGGAYGMPPPEEKTTIQGTVVSNITGDPIFGIKVSVEGTDCSARTNEAGDFYIYKVPIKNDYIIKFEDDDGEDNGGLFKEKTLPLKYDKLYKEIVTDMEKIR